MNEKQIEFILDNLYATVMDAKNIVLNQALVKYPELDQEEVAKLIQDHMNEIEF